MSVEKARRLRKEMTRYEIKLWLRLRELKALGLRFRRQAPFKGWIVDFACFASQLIVEVDGGQHGFEAHLAADAARDAALAAEGFHVLRVSNHDVWENIDGVMEMILSNGLPRLHMQTPAQSMREAT